MQRKPLRAAPFLPAVALLIFAGCASMEGLRGPPPAAPSSDRAAQDAATITRHYEVLLRLVQGSPAEQAEILAASRQAYEQTPSPAAQLRYGLVLAAPGHPARDPQLAQRLLREVLATPERLAPPERALALVELQRVDAELKLGGEVQRLTAQLAQDNRQVPARSASVVAASRRLQAEVEENARLRKELEEARAKLDAITTIERNITDRKPAVEGRQP